jgi:hypothetical protein
MTRRRAIAVLAALVVVGAAAGVALGAFAATTSNPASTIQAERIYPAARTTSAWTVEDAADNSAADVSSPIAYANDGLTYTTSTWTTSFQSTRHVDIDFNSPLPANVPVAGAAFRFDFSSNSGSTGCMYFEVRRASTGAVLGTFGSPASPVACQGTTLGSTSTDISSVVTTTDIANDLRIRIYGNETNSRGFKIDQATISGAAWSGFTLYRTRVDDAANGISNITNWAVSLLDTSVFQNAGNWSSAYAAGRYLKFTFPSYVPTSAVITGAQLVYTYKSLNVLDTTCFYFEVYDGTTLIGTHGSAAASLDCNATALYESITTALAEVNTPAEANNLVIKIYQRVSGSRPALADGVQVQITYALPSGSTCADAGTQTIESSGDSWLQQNSATGNNGTDKVLDVRTQTSSRNRRALVAFVLPELPFQCTVTGATLRMYLYSTGGARTISAFQVSSAWTEAGVTWATQPTITGTAATATTGAAATWTSWTVTSIIQAQYAGAAYGFLVRDAVEDATNTTQGYESRENTNIPELQLTFG